jgi:signal transduction histidine kinase
MNERIELHDGGREWDRLARVINDMLNRIAALLENLRQVSSDVAHDLRTPLTRLRNRLEQAREESATTADYVGAISAAIEDTDQILSIFGSLLSIAQVEAGSRLTKFAAVDLSGLCEKVFRIYGPVAEDYGHRLTADLAGDVVIRGDPELLTQMFTNLIENAIHHTPKGTTIGIALAAAAGDTVATVSDDGPGIAKDQTEKVLQRFYRLSSSRAAPGHGLGLALVAAVVQLHGGKLTLEDAAPGLKVAIRFPA